MTISAEGTFDYVVNVPAHKDDKTSLWPARLSDPLTHPSDPLIGQRLVGPSPTLQITDADPVMESASRRPRVPRSRLTLTASSRESATVSAISFYLDRRVTSLLQPGDVLHLARTPCAGLGVSVIRQCELVFAAGAVYAVPLGSGVEAKFPHDLIEEAEAVFRRRDRSFEFLELPIELMVGGERCILQRGVRRLGNYEVWVIHGFFLGEPGEDASIALLASGYCHTSAARASAMFLDGGDIEMVRWEG